MLVPHREVPPDTEKARKLVVLGSTGSIGQSTLSVVRQNPQHFSVVGLAAGSQIEAFAQQIAEFRPAVAVIADESKGAELRERLRTLGVSPEIVETGADAVQAIAAMPEADTVMAAVVGIAGLRSVISAVRSGKKVCLANKESLVCAGEIVQREASRFGATIVPVDSEHSALFQALGSERSVDIQSLILTASGGPFLRTPLSEFAAITPEQAIKHPRWSMGRKISVDSATMFNKGLELIEAHYLFNIPPAQIEAVVHPQSIVHSLVNFIDGTQLAQLSVPDMKGPIAYALMYPNGRLPAVMKPLRLAEIGTLEFFELDNQRFPAVSLARHSLEQGGTTPMMYNLANEVAVDSFLSRRLRFDQIPHFVESVLSRYTSAPCATVEGLFEAIRRARTLLAEELERR